MTVALSRLIVAGGLLAVFCCSAKAAKAQRPERLTPLDRFIEESSSGANGGTERPSPGSIWSPAARLGEVAGDLNAGQVGDLVTILVAERASAVSKGSTKSARASGARGSIGALGGLSKAAGPLANLADLKSESQLSGEGATSRESLLSTTLSARVTHVLPNGALVVEGHKDVQVNSEHQVVTVRGVIRPYDLNPGNVVRSDRLAHLEVRISGKGVVGDAVRRPFFLYRLLIGLLPL